MNDYSWIGSMAVGVVSGALSGAWFGGDTKATLRAHEGRLKTLEDDIRYEIRAIRENIHALRGEMMAVIHQERIDKLKQQQ